jgi:carbon monoxide dehydrogenase subunit G
MTDRQSCPHDSMIAGRPGGRSKYRVDASTPVAAPPAVVWTLLSDPHRYPELVDQTHRMVHVPDGPMGVGYTYREYAGVGPFKSESQWTVTEFEPDHRQVHEGDDGAMGMHLVIEIDRTGTGSRLTQRIALEPRGALKVGLTVLWPLVMRRLLQRSMDRTVANVRGAAESVRS